MKKALLFRFLWVLLLALAISSGISYYFAGSSMMENNISNMMDTVHVVDYSLHYEGRVQEELMQLYESSLDEHTRITIIELDGTVLADTGVGDVGKMENHMERKEVQQALKEGYGYATHYSETMGENMLYVAIKSERNASIIRMSIPYAGIGDYMVSIFPVLFIGVMIAFFISLVLTYRFTDTITKPLREISEEMKKVNSEEPEFSFRHYQYEELNIISDTTTKLSKEIREHMGQLEFEKKVRQEFFSNASHELKTPITSIKGYAELLDQGFVQDEDTKKDFMVRILKEIDNMTNLINDILQISRLETKEAEVTYSMVRMVPLVKEILESLEPISAEYQVSLYQECDPIVIEASAKQLRELIVNLVSNGIKYNHGGGSVWVKIRAEIDVLVISVKDNGMGISEEDQERVFERFYRVDKGRSKKMGGTGLGLSIVKHIVEYYEGNLQLVSAPGKGSAFTVKIPMKRCMREIEKANPEKQEKN